MADAGGVRAGRAYVEIGANDSALRKALASAQQRLMSFGATITKVGAGFLGAGASIITPMVAATKSFIDTGSELNDLSERTGATVESLSALKYAAQQTGAGLSDVETGIKKTSKAVTDASNGSKTATANLTDLGLSVAALAAMSPDQQFETVAKAIAAIEDPAKRTAAAIELWGKSGTALLPLAANLDSLKSAVASLGGIMSSAMAGAADALGDRLGDLQTTVGSLANQIGFALAPKLLEIVQVAAATVKVFGNWVSRNQETIVSVAKLGVGLVTAGAALTAMGTAALIVSKIIGATIFVMNAARAASFAFATVQGLVAIANWKVAASSAAAQVIMGGFVKVAAAAAVVGVVVGVIDKLSQKYGDLKGEIAGATAEIEKANAALKGGAAAGAEATATTPGTVSDRATNESIRKLHETRLKNIEDERERELNIAITRGENEIKRAREAGANDATLQVMRMTLAEELGQLERDQAKKTADEKARQAKELANLEEKRTDDIAKLRLESTLEGDDLKRATLALEEQQAIREATRNGENLDLVREEFDLKRQILEKELLAGAESATKSAIVQGKVGVSAFGSAGALASSVNSEQRRQYQKQLQLAEETKRIIDDIRQRIREYNQPQTVRI